MKTILALILLATIAHSAVVEDDALDFPGVDIVLESINIAGLNYNCNRAETSREREPTHQELQRGYT